jgi:hypothetical protein
MSDTLLQEMRDYKEIVELKARFVRMVDSKNWAGYRAVFIDDGHFEFGGGNSVRGGEAFVAAVRGMIDTGTSVHRAFLPEITFESATAAKGIWAVNDYIEWTTDPTGHRHGFQGFGYEYVTYRKIAGGWKIHDWRVHYVRMDPLPRLALPDSILGGGDLLRDKSYLAAVTARIPL